MAYLFEMKSRSSSNGEPVLPKILKKTMQKRLQHERDGGYPLFSIAFVRACVWRYVCVCNNPFTSTLACRVGESTFRASEGTVRARQDF